MSRKRTGGTPMKVHLLDPKNSEFALCQRPSFDVAYTRNHDHVTCEDCKREWQKRLNDLNDVLSLHGVR